MKLTADTITDAQIRALWKAGGNAISGRTLMIALAEPFPWGDYPSAEEIRVAREICAEVLNKRTRHIASIEADAESLQRGGSCRSAQCTCGWNGPQRSSLELAADDALEHEGSNMWLTTRGVE